MQLANLAPTINSAATAIITAIGNGGKVMFCGNGGSAADSQHLAAELMGRFLRDRAPLAAMALTTDTSAITAIGNDYGYEQIFARQLAGVGKAGDVLVAISPAATAANVLLAAEKARDMGIVIIALCGDKGGELAKMSDILINVPATRTDLIQEMHIAVGHILCGIVEEASITASDGRHSTSDNFSRRTRHAAWRINSTDAETLVTGGRRPFIDYWLDKLAAVGIADIILACGHLRNILLNDTTAKNGKAHRYGACRRTNPPAPAVCWFCKAGFWLKNFFYSTAILL